MRKVSLGLVMVKADEYGVYDWICFIPQIGFLLGSCGVSVALTSEACFKGIPKTSAGDVVSFKGWPKLTWFITDHLPKPPKDWQMPPRHSDDTAAYIEVRPTKNKKNAEYSIEGWKASITDQGTEGQDND